MAADVAVVVNALLNEESTPEKYISTVLDCLEEKKSLQESRTTSEWIGKVNGYLNSKKERSLGLCMLEATIEQCDTDAFNANCCTWVRALLQIIQSSPESRTTIHCAIQLLENILQYAVQFSELSRTLATSILPSILGALLSLPDQLDSLSGLSACMRHMPGPAGAVKVQIEDLVVSCFEHSNENIRKASSECFALLASLSSGGGGQNKQQINWELQWRRLLLSLKQSLEMLYEDTSEHSSFESRVQLGELLSLKDVPDEEPSRTMTLATRCAAMLDALTAMTRTGISRFAVIPLEQTLQLVERVSSITEPVLKQSGSLTVVLLRTVLPLVHIPAIDLLSALIQRCGSLLLPFTSQIGNLLTRSLGWTGNATNNNHEQARPYSKLRCAVYECIINWSHLNCSLSQQMFSKLVASILSDITPQVSQTKLIAPVDQGRSKKAKKRKLQEDVEELATRQRKMNPLCNKSVCNKALQGLSSLLMDGVKMPANNFQDLQSAVLSLILQCQSTYPLPPPYSDVVCRQGLYRGLLACLICRPPGAPSIIHCAVQCFTCGMQDPSLQISCYCREALTVTTALMHPAVPTLGETFQLVKLQSAFHFTSSIERPPLHANDELSRESQKSLVVSGESISTMRSDDQEPRMNETSPSDVPTRGNIVGVDSSTSQTGNLVGASRRQMDSCTTSESEPMETTTTNDVRKSSKMVYPEDQFSDPKHAPKSIATETRSTVETLDHLLSNSKGNSVKKISDHGEMSKTKNMPSSLSNGSENVVKKVPDVPPPKKTRYEETSPELKNTTQGSERMVTGEVRVNKSAAAATNAEASTVDMGCSLKQAEDDMEAMLASFVNSSPDSDELDHYEL